jgi:hypothetical protein
MSQKTNMSLDNTSHPGRPGLDELVPSRYALRVGEIDVMVVSDGVLSLPGAMLGHNADPAVRAAWLNDMFLPPDVLEWALTEYRDMLVAIRDNVAKLKRRSLDDTIAAKPTATFDAKWGQFVITPDFFTRLVYHGV